MVQKSEIVKENDKRKEICGIKFVKNQHEEMKKTRKLMPGIVCEFPISISMKRVKENKLSVKTIVLDVPKV